MLTALDPRPSLRPRPRAPLQATLQPQRRSERRWGPLHLRRALAGPQAPLLEKQVVQLQPPAPRGLEALSLLRAAPPLLASCPAPTRVCVYEARPIQVRPAPLQGPFLRLFLHRRGLVPLQVRPQLQAPQPGGFAGRLPLATPAGLPERMLRAAVVCVPPETAEPEAPRASRPRVCAGADGGGGYG